MPLWGLAVLAALLIGLGLVQGHPLAVRAPALRATIDTAVVLCTLSAAWLLNLNSGYTRRMDGLLLLVGLLWVAFVEIGSDVVPSALGFYSGRLPAAAARVGGVIAAAMFAFAALRAADGRVTAGRRLLASTIAYGALAVTLTTLGGLLLHDAFAPTGVAEPQGAAEALQHPVLLAISLSAAWLLIAAAIGVARKARAGDRHLSPMLVVGFSALAAAQLQYLVMQPFSTEWVIPSDGLRLLGYVVILAAALRDEALSRRKLTVAVAMNERRRLARDLHDGLAQDLAFIAAHGERIARELGDDAPLAVAARRALAVSRGAILDLSAAKEPTARTALETIAHELGIRFGVSIALEVEELELDQTARENVVRIAREAIVNAAQAEARRVVVSLRRSGHAFILRVRDDGRGIEVRGRQQRRGFGLRCMRERAAALGGSLAARETTDGGTELVVIFR